MTALTKANAYAIAVASCLLSHGEGEGLFKLCEEMLGMDESLLGRACHMLGDPLSCSMIELRFELSTPPSYVLSWCVATITLSWTYRATTSSGPVH